MTEQTVRDHIAATMARADGWDWAGAVFSTLDTPGANRYRKLAEAVLAVLPAPVDRATVLREAADAIEEAQHRRDDAVNDRLGALDDKTFAEHVAVHRSGKLLRRMAEEAQR